MRILLVSRAFPPAPFSGALRARNLARTFVKAGHEVHVITAAGERPPRAEVSGPGRLFLHPVRPVPGIKQLYRRLKAHTTNGRAGNGNGRGDPEGVKSAWKRFVLSLLAVPDDEKGFILPAVTRALRCGARSFDVVYTTAPPHSTQLIGLLLKTVSRARWIMEYRDPWTGVARAAKLDSRLARWLNARLEHRCLRRADDVVAVSEGIREIVGRRAPRRQRVRLVRNGIDRIAPAAPAGTRRPGPLRIVYAGSLYMGRDPRPFIRAVGILRRRCSIGPDDLDIHFVGNCRRFNGISLERFAAAEGVADLFRFTDWVPHERARELIDRADLLLLLAQAQPAQVPNKLYEYLGSGRRILALADEASETSVLLGELSGHYVVRCFEPEPIAHQLEHALADRPRLARTAAEAELLESLTTERQMAKLLDELQL